MTRLNVNPTRMELQRLKQRLGTATRGHKLLKDKQDELVRQFITIAKDNNQLRHLVETGLTSGLTDFVLAKSTINENFIEELFAIPGEAIELTVNEKTILNVPVPILNVEYAQPHTDQSLRYGYLDSNAELDASIDQLHQLVPSLLSLAETEKTCQLLSAEIERTRRRVNALEYLTIPQLTETIDFIQMRLEENERATITRMIKIKDKERD